MTEIVDGPIVERGGKLYRVVYFSIAPEPPKRAPKRRVPSERERLLDALWDWDKVIRQRGWLNRRASTERDIRAIEGMSP